MGLQHGRALKEEIAAIRGRIVKYLRQSKGWPLGLLAYPVFSILARRMARFIPREYREEMMGIAKGAGLSYSIILIINVIDDLFNNFMCSSFTFRGEKLIYGRNLDYPVFTEFMSSISTVLSYRPDRGNSFLSIAWPGYIGVVTGMSDRGLVISSLTSPTKDKKTKGTPSGLLYRRALQFSHSLEDMKKIIIESPRTLGNNILLASPEESIVLETSAGRWAERMDKNFLTVTNHFQTEEMINTQGPFGHRPIGSTLPEYCFTMEYSLSRDRRLKELCQKGNVELEGTIAILRDREIANAGNVQSVIFLPQDLSVWVAEGSDPPVSAGKFVLLPNDLLRG